MTPLDWFLRPGWLAAAVALPLAAWLLLRAGDRRAVRLLTTLAGHRAAELGDELLARRRRTARIAFAGGLLLALGAIAEPVWGVRARQVEQRGIDLVVCLDVSRSMLARDVRPDRLRRAHAEIRALAERTRGDRLALVVFAGEARLRVPLTRDVATFADLVEQQDPLAVERGGTDLGAALDVALQAFGTDGGTHRTIVLVTDGEDRDGAALPVAERCAQAGVVVHCVGMGTAIGSKIVVQDAAGNETFLRDRDGNEVVSALDSTSLRRIARATGGAFVDGAAGTASLVRLFEQRIVPLASRPKTLAEGAERAPRYQWLLAAAMLAWLAELLAVERRRP
ncbi:MAG: VWA domain-containing protein [Planctomycetes bacterium]|nr:VWA domain-containing protein [Planctomycetota bacterium]